MKVVVTLVPCEGHRKLFNSSSYEHRRRAWNRPGVKDWSVECVTGALHLSRGAGVSCWRAGRSSQRVRVVGGEAPSPRIDPPLGNQASHRRNLVRLLSLSFVIVSIACSAVRTGARSGIKVLGFTGHGTAGMGVCHRSGRRCAPPCGWGKMRPTVDSCVGGCD
jgi:hypothetical protein